MRNTIDFFFLFISFYFIFYYIEQYFFFLFFSFLLCYVVNLTASYTLPSFRETYDCILVYVNDTEV